VGLLLADLDHFKLTNDTRGHLVGDEVLREVARRMLASIRVYDAAGRYGGEEFLILLLGCDEASTLEKAEKIRAALDDLAVETPEGPVRVTLSIGGVSSRAWDQADANTLLWAADGALYRVKAAGRNRVERAVPGDPSTLYRPPAEDLLALQGQEHPRAGSD